MVLIVFQKQKYTVNNQFELTEFIEEDWMSKPKFEPVVQEEKTTKKVTTKTKGRKNAAF